MNDNHSSVEKTKSFSESLKYAVEGLTTAVREEHNMRSHLISAVFVLFISLFLNLNLQEWLWIFLAIFMVIMTELSNTIIENVTDIVTDNKWHPLAKKAKDMSAGLSLLAAIFSIVVGLLVLVPKFF